MNNQIYNCQQRLFYKLFATFPSAKKTNKIFKVFNLDLEVKDIYFFRNKSVWFTRCETKDKFLFLFGIKDKPIKNICGDDTCLIIDFDKNIQLNDSCLGLFSIETSEIHILINWKILKERYPKISIRDFKIKNFKSFDNSLNLDVFDLGNLNIDFIDNLDNLVKEAYFIKSQNETNPQIIKTDLFENKDTIAKMNMILEDLANGNSEEDAIVNANVSENTYNYWINRGKQDFGELYVQFYDYITEFKSKKHESDSNDGFSDEKRTFEDKGIFDPLLDEYEISFSSMNQSGIAWVNKTGSKWTYSRKINGNAISLSANTIPELYERVIGQDLIWGIRDYDKAKKVMDFPDDFEIPSKPQVEENEVDINVKVDPDIYSPLPEKYEKTFSSMSKSGIAWVNQIGNKLYYTKSINGKSIRLSGENIYELYEKVKKANQIWGIRDYSKAGQYIDIPKDFEIPEKQAVEENEIISDTEINESIYSPLSQEHLSKFNPNPKNKTGIAWVNKVGNQWIYQRQRNGKMVKISDSNIIKLHEKVIKNNQIWGIFDINKAKKAIETNSIEDTQDHKPPKPIKPIITSDVTVNYIEKPKNLFEILIKGIIKNSDLINVLMRLDLFKDNIKRIIINSINKDLDIFIELEVNKILLQDFEEKIEDFGWKVNK